MSWEGGKGIKQFFQRAVQDQPTVIMKERIGMGIRSVAFSHGSRYLYGIAQLCIFVQAFISFTEWVWILDWWEVELAVNESAAVKSVNLGSHSQ